jgi:hypothetical protein
MRETNGIITRTDARLMGLYPLSATPADSNRLVTKGWLKSNYYIDVSAFPMSIYTDNRCIKYQDALTSAIGPLPGFYEYDVTRNSIPGADGGYFTYTSATGTTETILQNSYGYVGRFCMEEDSFRNNQWNLYSISQVGVCFPENAGLGYPLPESPQYQNSYFTFTTSPTMHVEGFALYTNGGGQVFAQNGTYSNTFYITSSILVGTYFARYSIYDNAGNFLYKVGYRGFPAKKVIILGERYYYYTVDRYNRNCQYESTGVYALTSIPPNVWLNAQNGSLNIVGSAAYTPTPFNYLSGELFNASTCSGGNFGGGGGEEPV